MNYLTKYEHEIILYELISNQRKTITIGGFVDFPA